MGRQNSCRPIHYSLCTSYNFGNLLTTFAGVVGSSITPPWETKIGVAAAFTFSSIVVPPDAVFVSVPAPIAAVLVSAASVSAPVAPAPVVAISVSVPVPVPAAPVPLFAVFLSAPVPAPVAPAALFAVFVSVPVPIALVGSLSLCFPLSSSTTSRTDLPSSPLQQTNL